MNTYNPETAPDPQTWLDLDESERTSLVISAHEGRFPDALHNGDANEFLHASLHAIVEMQIASGDPAATGLAIERLTTEGLTRHAALHAVMRLFAVGLGKLSTGDARFDTDAWEGSLDRLSSADAVGEALQSARFQEPEPMNRAQRRAAKRRKR